MNSFFAPCTAAFTPCTSDITPNMRKKNKPKNIDDKPEFITKTFPNNTRVTFYRQHCKCEPCVTKRRIENKNDDEEEDCDCDDDSIQCDSDSANVDSSSDVSYRDIQLRTQRMSLNKREYYESESDNESNY